MTNNDLQASAETINGHHKAIGELQKSRWAEAIGAGRELIAVRRRLAHGEFMPFVREKLICSHSKVNQYMRHARDAVFIEAKFALDPNLRPGDMTLKALLELGRTLRQAASGTTKELSQLLTTLDQLGGRLSAAEFYASGPKVEPELIARVQERLQELLAYDGARDAYLDVSIDESEGEPEADAAEDPNDLLGPLFRRFAQLDQEDQPPAADGGGDPED